MENTNSSSINKIILTVALFLIFGFVIDLLMGSNKTTTTPEQNHSDIMKVVTNNANSLANIETKLTNLEDNLNKGKNSNINTSNTVK